MPIFLWLGSVITNSIVLPSFLGLHEISILPMFFSALAFYVNQSKSVLFWGMVLSVTTELTYDIRIGSYLVPFLFTAGIYYWASKFIDIGNLAIGTSFSLILYRSVIILLLGLVFCLVFVFYQKGLGDSWYYISLFLNISFFYLNFFPALVYSYLMRKFI